MRSFRQKFEFPTIEFPTIEFPTIEFPTNEFPTNEFLTIEFPTNKFTTNKFTYGYKEFVNTYGIPRYREANPALFTAATFPFLFGVMYGDIGHGTCRYLEVLRLGAMDISLLTLICFYLHI